MSEPLTSEHATPPQQQTKVGYLVAGLVFLGIAAVWALSAAGALGGITVGVLVPAVLIVAGVLGLLATIAGNVRRPRTRHDVTQHDDRLHDRSTDEDPGTDHEETP